MPRKPYVILLSGTPNPKGLRDLFAQYRIMDDTIFGTAVADFDERYVRKHPYHKWKILGYDRERELMRKIRAHSVAVSADEAGMANEQSFEYIKVDMPTRVKKMYLQLATDFIMEWEGGVISAKNAGVKRMRLLQLCGGFTTDGQVLHEAKVRALRDYAHLLLEQGESLVVYGRFTPEVEQATAALKKLGYRTYRVDGSTSAADRRRGIASLAKRPDSPVAVVFQYQAGSRALELVGAAETVFFSPSDSWVDYWGALKRTQGPNQKRPVRYTHLICPGTVDVSAMKGLRRKEDAHAVMMKNPRRYLLGLI